MATTLERATGRPPSGLEAVVQNLLDGVEERYEELEDAGPDGLLASYRNHCSTIGALVRIEDAKESYTARALDISDDGRLVV